MYTRACVCVYILCLNLLSLSLLYGYCIDEDVMKCDDL